MTDEILRRMEIAIHKAIRGLSDEARSALGQDGDSWASSILANAALDTIGPEEVRALVARMEAGVLNIKAK